MHNAWKLLKVRLYRISQAICTLLIISIVNFGVREAYVHVYHLVLQLVISHHNLQTYYFRCINTKTHIESSQTVGSVWPSNTKKI